MLFFNFQLDQSYTLSGKVKNFCDEVLVIIVLNIGIRLVS